MIPGWILELPVDRIMVIHILLKILREILSLLRQNGFDYFKGNDIFTKIKISSTK